MTDQIVRPADQEIGEEAQKVIATVRKLLALANKNPNPEEAASAAAKAQKMLAEHNIQMSLVEEETGKAEGRREKAKMTGGMYTYQRDLWKAVAELNFCLYWNQQTWEERRVQTHDPYGRWNNEKQKYQYYIWEVKWARTWRHALVGRIVNTQTSAIMAQYLEQAIERLLEERLGERINSRYAYGSVNQQRFSSWAVAYREGAVYDLVTRLKEKRRGMIDEMEKAAREAEARAREAGTSLERTLSVEVMAQSEQDANYDHLYGEGWSAKQRADRAERARLAAEAEAAHARWAAENPEEAAKQAAKEAEEDRKYWARYRGGRSEPDRASDKNPGAWSAGRRDAASISIDTQVGKAEKPRRLK